MINIVFEFIDGGVDIYLLFCETADVVTLNASPSIGEFEWKGNCIDGIRYHAGVLYIDEVEGEVWQDIEPILEEYVHVNVCCHSYWDVDGEDVKLRDELLAKK